MTDQQYPKGILPVLPVADVDATTDYYIKALRFEEIFRQRSPDGVAQNAQLGFEESTLMLNLNPDHAPLEGGGIYLWIRLFDTKIDDYYEALQRADANIVEEIRNQFWGDRSFVIKDCNNFHIAFNQAVTN